MSSYRIARRAFMRSIGAGAVGLKTLLRTMEASAQGAAPPPRFLMTHWPVGTQKYWFAPVAVGSNPNPTLPTLPTAAPNGTNWDFSRILKPFGDAGLKNDMIVLYGLNSGGVGRFGGGHEAGTPQTTTGAATPGTRSNGGETDDAVAGGPSWDQIFLKSVPELDRAASGAGYANAICDARIDSYETSTQCLSYDYGTRSVAAAQGGSAGMVTENIPLMPTLSPFTFYNNVFSGRSWAARAAPTTRSRCSSAARACSTHSTDQLARLRELAPGSERSKIDFHAEAIRRVELMISDQIKNGSMTPAMCVQPPAPSMTLLGKTGSRSDYRSTPTHVVDGRQPDPRDDRQDAHGDHPHGVPVRPDSRGDVPVVAGHEPRVVQRPDAEQPTASYMHHPTSHLINQSSWSLTAPASSGNVPAPTALQMDVLQFLANVQTWYNQKMADILVTFKNSTDIFGGNLLANTVIPYVTEVAETNHSKSSLPAIIFGGSALGMKGGQWQSVNRPHNDLWLTIAQAYFKTTSPLTKLPASFQFGNPAVTLTNTFQRTGVAPIPGLWAMP